MSALEKEMKDNYSLPYMGQKDFIFVKDSSQINT